MQLIFGQYEHCRIGFPGVCLKWIVERGEITDAYITVKGVILRKWAWFNQYPGPHIQHELDIFNEWTVSNYKNDVSVQG